jgi:hypothetical protein
LNDLGSGKKKGRKEGRKERKRKKEGKKKRKKERRKEGRKEGMIVCVSNAITWQAEPGRLRVQSQLVT